MLLQRFLVRCVIAVAPATTGAQDLDVRLERASGSRLGGALVALVDSTDRVHVEVLSGETGRVSLAAPAGSYRVRVRRIEARADVEVGPRGAVVGGVHCAIEIDGLSEAVSAEDPKPPAEADDLMEASLEKLGMPVRQDFSP